MVNDVHNVFLAARMVPFGASTNTNDHLIKK
jgi:hypothetical protein